MTEKEKLIKIMTEALRTTPHEKYETEVSMNRVISHMADRIVEEYDFYKQLAKDPLYPCAKCKSGKDKDECPQMCLKYKLWFSVNWINIQYNSGIITEAEKEKRINDAYARYGK
ncbi:MAG: hypothetical protein ACI4JN_08680 [Ruminococcus sp.]